MARARFTLGLLALHNFQYELAQELFERADATERWGRIQAHLKFSILHLMSTTCRFTNQLDCLI